MSTHSNDGWNVHGVIHSICSWMWGRGFGRAAGLPLGAEFDALPHSAATTQISSLG